MTRTRYALLALAFCVGLGGAGLLPPPLDPWGAWFCCDSAGNCALATSACGPTEDLVWCYVVGEDPATGLSICLD